MNIVNIIGNLCSDPAIRNTSNNKKIANFTVAVRGTKEHTDFIRCVAFGRNAEYVEKYGKKGGKIIVSGSLHVDSYVNKEGNRVNTADVYVNDVELTSLTAKQAMAEYRIVDDADMPFA